MNDKNWKELGFNKFGTRSLQGDKEYQSNEEFDLAHEDASIRTSLIKGKSVTSDKLADEAVGGSTISDGTITNAKLSNMATKTYKGRTSGGTGVPENVDITTLKSDISLNNVDNTSDVTKNAASVTLTNKRITRREGHTASSATPTINTDNVDIYLLTAQTANITSMTTNLSGTPTEGQMLWISIKGTADRAITWGSKFESSTVSLPTTTVTTARLDINFIWNTTTSCWRCVMVS